MYLSAPAARSVALTWIDTPLSTADLTRGCWKTEIGSLTVQAIRTSCEYLESVTVTTTTAAAAFVGLPDMTPVVVEMLRPAGNPVAE